MNNTLMAYVNKNKHEDAIWQLAQSLYRTYFETHPMTQKIWANLDLNVQRTWYYVAESVIQWIK